MFISKKKFDTIKSENEKSVDVLKDIFNEKIMKLGIEFNEKLSVLEFKLKNPLGVVSLCTGNYFYCLDIYNVLKYKYVYKNESVVVDLITLSYSNGLLIRYKIILDNNVYIATELKNVKTDIIEQLFFVIDTNDNKCIKINQDTTDLFDSAEWIENK